MRFWRKGLGRRIVALMILASAALSVISAAVQLWMGYQRDLGTVLTEFSVVEESFLSGLENALWQFNFLQVEVLLDGILAQADVTLLRLDAETGQSWERGLPTQAQTVTRHFPLIFDGQPPTELGVLTVTVTLEHIRERLLQQFWTLLLSNFLKTLAASFAMLVIFDKMIARHLRHLASDTRGGAWETGEQQFQLDRTHNDDELGQIVTALNDAGKRIRETLGVERARARELKMVNERLHNANREQAEFTYAISHDLKSPSNTIGMLIDELADIRPDDAEVADVLSDMTRTNDRMRGLVDDILDYSQTIEKKPASDRVDLAQLAQAVAEDLAADVVASGATLRIGDLPTIPGDATQLRVLFQNLISNAIKFRAPDRAPVVEISQENVQDSLLILVKDNGIGIPQQYREKVFGLFQRLHARDEYEGTGLGLTVCRRIMSNHDGTVKVRSNGDIGTVFELEFWRGDKT